MISGAFPPREERFTKQSDDAGEIPQMWNPDKPFRVQLAPKNPQPHSSPAEDFLSTQNVT